MQWHPVVAAASSWSRSEAIGTKGRRILNACDPLSQCLCLCAVGLLGAHISSIPRAHVFLAFSGQLGPLLTLGAVGLADLISPPALYSRDKSGGLGGGRWLDSSWLGLDSSWRRRGRRGGRTGPQQQTGSQQQGARHQGTGAGPQHR
jgi:hypothetical protein